MLAEELARIEAGSVNQRRVLFVDNLGFVTPTAARQIRFEEALRFEVVHEEAYRAFGYELVRIAPAALQDRVAAIREALAPLLSSEQPV